MYFKIEIGKGSRWVSKKKADVLQKFNYREMAFDTNFSVEEFTMQDSQCKYCAMIYKIEWN